MSLKPNKTKAAPTLSDAVVRAIVKLTDDGASPPDETFAGKMEEVIGKLEDIAATADADQAPSLPFAPYQNDYYNTPYSKTLIDKSNARANKIWNGRDGYTQGQVRYHNKSDVSEGNKAFLDRNLATECITSILSINQYVPAMEWAVRQNIVEVIKRIKQVEKRHGEDELFDDAVREQIINCVLMPANMYGASDHHGFYAHANIRFMGIKSVVNGLLTIEDIIVAENIINYIPKIRLLLSNFLPHGGQRVKEDRLLVSLNTQPNKFNRDADKQYLEDLRNMAEFFDTAFPHAVTSDLIPELKYPTAVHTKFGKFRDVSVALRDASVGYMQETVSLSKLLQCIVDLAEVIKEYFYCVLNQTDACMNYLNRINMTYEQLVTESKQRVNDSEYPF